MTAQTAATVDLLSNGRMRLGLGAGGPEVTEGWHGVRWSGQLRRTREYVEVVRAVLEGGLVEYQGETIKLPLPDGPGVAQALSITDRVPGQIPIYLAAIGPKNTALAAEIADGWIPVLVSPEHMAQFRPALEQGWARANRDGSDFDIAPAVAVCIDDDIDAARDLARETIAFYIGGMGTREKNFYVTLITAYGFGDAARRIQDLYLDGKHGEAEAAIPGELIDAVALCGPADRIRDRIAIYRDAGVGTLIALPRARTIDARLAQIRQFAELAAA
jgi:F420-dependent oxidoreductase-like protein